MAAVIEQQERLISLDTPLGENVLILESFRGHEELSRLFNYELEMLSDRDDIAASEIVGKNITFFVKLTDGEEQAFNGYVRRFTGGQLHTRTLRRYRAEVVPWLWFLTRTSDCRIFQNKSIPEIIEEIFQDLDFSDFETSDIKGEHPKREYCVQFRETSFNFVSRLMEEEGIFYYFRHEDGKHTLVLADQKGVYKDCPENEIECDYGSLDADHISSWEHQYEYRSGKWAQTDYNFKTPSTKLLTSTDTLVDLPSIDKYEMFDYWGRYNKKSDGEALTKLRMEEEEVPYDVVYCTSGCRTLYPGGKFTLKTHECPSEEGKSYVITSIQHSATDNTHLSGGAGESDYENSFTCIPDSVVFRPDSITPRPVVQGPQTAVVVGPSGEEIYTDEYGRVKVQFHWDRKGQNDENSSCWVRVAQHWAGKQWGFICNPRIGQEVIVDFLEGDPDSPILNGRVYNAEQMPPYDLPANQTQSGIKSRSSKGGDPSNFNEIRFEDKKGAEEVYIHAEKNHNQITENDRSEDVGHDRSLHVGNDKSEGIDNNKSIEVGNDHTESIGVNKTLTVGSNHTESIGADKKLDVGSNHTESIGSNMTISVGSNLTETVAINYAETVGVAMELTVGAAMTETVGAVKTQSIGANKSISIGANKSEDVSANKSVSVGGNLSESIKGQHSESVTKEYSLKAKKVLVTADDEIVLKTGQASISMKKDGTINIQGKDISVKGSGDISVKASKNITMKGTKILEN
jgi:type VI secretion system secreted protein VgrG